MSQTNVDPLEIEKFQSLASRWWDTESEFKPLHDINPLRVDYIDNNCGGVEGKKILDIGCGGGILCEALAQRGAIVTGIDMDKLLDAGQFISDFLGRAPVSRAATALLRKKAV